MTSAILAALMGVLVLGFVEGLARFYPSKRTWLRLRSAHGRRAVRAMRLRLEAVADRGTPRRLAGALTLLVFLWISVSSWLDKFWYEVALDASPYLIVAIALLRAGPMLRRIADRMRRYEREAGEDPDKDYDQGGNGGPAAIAI